MTRSRSLARSGSSQARASRRRNSWSFVAGRSSAGGCRETAVAVEVTIVQRPLRPVALEWTATGVSGDNPHRTLHRTGPHRPWSAHRGRRPVAVGSPQPDRAVRRTGCAIRTLPSSRAPGRVSNRPSAPITSERRRMGRACTATNPASGAAAVNLGQRPAVDRSTTVALRAVRFGPRRRAAATGRWRPPWVATRLSDRSSGPRRGCRAARGRRASARSRPTSPLPRPPRRRSGAPRSTCP